jgi:peptidoglycan hydrolase CwlO-like protein
MTNGNLERILTELSVKVDDVKTGINQIDTKINTLETKIEKIDTKVEALATEVNDVKIGIAKLEEKINGSTGILDAKLTGIDKRMSNEEFISRSTFASLFAGTVAGFVK